MQQQQQQALLSWTCTLNNTKSGILHIYSREAQFACDSAPIKIIFENVEKWQISQGVLFSSLEIVTKDKQQVRQVLFS